MAACGGGGGGSNPNLSVLVQSQRGPCAASQPLEAFFLSGSSPSFLGILSNYLFALLPVLKKLFLVSFLFLFNFVNSWCFKLMISWINKKFRSFEPQLPLYHPLFTF
jgi:hypothetical protein